MWPLDDATARTIVAISTALAAAGTLVNLILLAALVRLTDRYAGSTNDLAIETRKLSTVSAQSVAGAERDRRDRKVGLLRAVAAEIQRAGLLAQGVRDRKGLVLDAPSFALVRVHTTELASVVPFEVFYELWTFADQARIAAEAWAVAAKDPTPSKDLDLVTDLIIRDARVVSSMLIVATTDEETAVKAARALAVTRRGDAEAWEAAQAKQQGAPGPAQRDELLDKEDTGPT